MTISPHSGRSNSSRRPKGNSFPSEICHTTGGTLPNSASAPEQGNRTAIPCHCVPVYGDRREETQLLGPCGGCAHPRGAGHSDLRTIRLWRPRHLLAHRLRTPNTCHIETACSTAPDGLHSSPVPHRRCLDQSRAMRGLHTSAVRARLTNTGPALR